MFNSMYVMVLPETFFSIKGEGCGVSTSHPFGMYSPFIAMTLKVVHNEYIANQCYMLLVIMD
jgi:hypothetical protein